METSIPLYSLTLPATYKDPERDPSYSTCWPPYCSTSSELAMIPDDGMGPKVLLCHFVKSPFLPRDAMRKRGHCCRPGPSVRLSVTFVHCIQMAEDIVKLLSLPGRHTILVFRSRAPVPNSKGNPFRRAQNTRGWKNFATFD